jgi:hypothetical protein
VISVQVPLTVKTKSMSCMLTNPKCAQSVFYFDSPICEIFDPSFLNPENPANPCPFFLQSVAIRVLIFLLSVSCLYLPWVREKRYTGVSLLNEN